MAHLAAHVAALHVWRRRVVRLRRSLPPRRAAAASVRAILVHHHLPWHLAVNLRTSVSWRYADESRLEWDAVGHGAHALVRVHVAGAHPELAHLLHGEDAWLSTEPLRARAVAVRTTWASRSSVRSSAVARHGHAGWSHAVALRHQTLHAHVLRRSVLAEVAHASGHLALRRAEVLHLCRVHPGIRVAGRHALKHGWMRMLLVARHLLSTHHLLWVVMLAWLLLRVL